MTAFGARTAEPELEPSLATTLESSVRAHLVADVEIGAFLSGGLDSSLLVAMASRHNPAIRCYTIGFRPADQQLEAMPDDLRYARRQDGDHRGRRFDAHRCPSHPARLGPAQGPRSRALHLGRDAAREEFQGNRRSEQEAANRQADSRHPTGPEGDVVQGWSE